MGIGVRPQFLVLILLFAAPALAQEQVLRLPNGQELRYQVVEPNSGSSARETANQLLRHLADGNVEAAAAMSNAPQRRLEVLIDFRQSVGEEQFKRLFGRYFAPENRLLLEVALGPRRLLVWDLGEAGNRLAGQYYIQVDGKFVLDDVPSTERRQLQRVLEAHRKETTR